MILVAFCFQFNMYPMYCSLKEKNNKNAMAATNWGLFATLVIYVSIAILGMAMFGTNVEQSVLTNVNAQSDHWESYVLRVSFLLVLGCHIPFLFYSGKEGFLIMVDEVRVRSISKNLEARLSRTESDRLIDNGESQGEDSKLAYKDMPTGLYIFLTTMLYLAELYLSMVLNDLGLIFEFNSAIAVSMIAYILPSYFYLCAIRKFGKPQESSSWECKSKFLLVVGVFLMIF